MAVMLMPLHTCLEVVGGSILPMQTASASLHSCLVSCSLYKQNFNHPDAFKKTIKKLSVFDFLYSFCFPDVTRDKEELHNVVLKFPNVRAHLDKRLRSIIDYPEVSTTVHLYNEKAFIAWQHTLGNNYSKVIGSLRWHVDWQKDALANERAIDKWLSDSL